MRTFQKILLALGLAAIMALGIVWGGDAGAFQRASSVAIENIQKPGHLALADVVY